MRTAVFADGELNDNDDETITSIIRALSFICHPALDAGSKKIKIERDTVKLQVIAKDKGNDKRQKTKTTTIFPFDFLNLLQHCFVCESISFVRVPASSAG